MAKIEVCLTPAMIHLFDPKGKIVVVTDIFRASSSMVSGLARGIKKIKPVAKVAESVIWHEKGFLRAGERNGVKVEGFDLGNSPFEFMDEQYSNKSIVMTTTNGTKAIHVAEAADEILIGAFLNLAAVGEYLQHNNSKDVLIICAGWKNHFSMEDTLFAGALATLLLADYEIEGDASLAAITLYEAAKSDLYAYLQNAGHAKRLSGLNFEKDIRFCLECNRFTNLPVIVNGFIKNREEDHG